MCFDHRFIRLYVTGIGNGRLTSIATHTNTVKHSVSDRKRGFLGCFCLL